MLDLVCQKVEPDTISRWARLQRRQRDSSSLLAAYVQFAGIPMNEFKYIRERFGNYYRALTLQPQHHNRPRPAGRSMCPRSAIS